LIYLLIALIVAAIIVLGGRWLYHAIRDENEPAKQPATTSTDKTAEQKAASENEKSQSSSSNKSSGSTSSDQPASSEGQSGSNSSGGSDELANTGPGQVVALFITVSLAAAGLHYAYQRRRTS
jgi:cytoskeletal protein RodZ